MTKTRYTGVTKDPKTGKYMYYFKAGVDLATGKPYQQRRRGFRTAKEAFEARTAAMQKVQARGMVKHTQLNFQNFMEVIFLPDYYGRTRQDINDRRKVVFDEFIKTFGKKKPRDITLLDVSKYQNELLSRHSSSYVRLKMALLKQVMKSAYNHGLITHDIVTDKLPPVSIKKKEIEFWTKDEFEKVISTLDRDDYMEHFVYTLFWLYYFTGMRVSEGLALYWDNIDLERKQISIQYNLQYVNRHNWVRSEELKTKGSKRIIGIDDVTVEVLKSWKKRQAEHSEIDFVLSFNGAPYPRRSILDQIIKYSKKAGVKRIQTKGLRHSHASLLINEYNTNILLVQKRLGHKNVEMTLSVYSHLYPNADESITSQLSSLFEPKLPK